MKHISLYENFLDTSDDIRDLFNLYSEFPIEYYEPSPKLGFEVVKILYVTFKGPSERSKEASKLASSLQKELDELNDSYLMDGQYLNDEVVDDFIYDREYYNNFEKLGYKPIYNRR